MAPHDRMKSQSEISGTVEKLVEHQRKWILRLGENNLPASVRKYADTISDPTPSSSSRRRWLQAMGAGAMLSVAGCAEDEPADPGQNGQTGSGGEEGVVFSTTTSTSDPSRINFNAYHPDHSVGDAFWQFMSHFVAHRSSGHRTLVPDLVEWEMVEPDLAHITIREELEGLTWLNGNPVTAEDLRAKIVLERLTDQRPHELDDSYDIIDDQTLAIQMNQPINEETYFNTIASTPFNTRYDLYEEWVEWAVESDYDPEVIDDLQDATFDDPTGNGPWELVERTSDAFYFELRDDHPWSDRFNWNECEYVFTPQRDVMWQRVITDNTSAEMGRMPATIVDQIPDHFRWYQAPTRFGMSVSLHFDTIPEHTARKGIAWALDANTLADNTGLAPDEGLGGTYIESQTGLYEPEEAIIDAIGEELFDAMEWYEPRNVDTALAHFEEANYEYDGETMYYPGGDDPVTFEIIAPTFLPFYIPVGETAIDQLSEIGIEGSVNVQEPGGYLSGLATGQFDAAVYYTGGNTWDLGQQMTWNWWTERIDRPVNNGVDLDGHPVPWPPGNPDGDLEEINIRDHVHNLESHDEENRREALQALTWAHNQTLPHYLAGDGLDTLVLNENQFEGPDDDDPISGEVVPSAWVRRPAIQANQ